MAFVVTESCIKCKYTDCVEVCPVDCFHEGPNFLVIDPEECIDCTLCEPECPVEAIFSEDEVPAGQEEFKKINADLAKKWPVIAEKKARPARCEAVGRRGGEEEAAGNLNRRTEPEVAAERSRLHLPGLQILHELARRRVARQHFAARQEDGRRSCHGELVSRVRSRA